MHSVGAALVEKDKQRHCMSSRRRGLVGVAMALVRRMIANARVKMLRANMVDLDSQTSRMLKLKGRMTIYCLVVLRWFAHGSRPY